MNRHLLLVAAAALLGACTAGKDTKPVAKADPPYVFPHSPHVDGDVDCKLCHGAILKATELENRVRHVALPKKSDDCSGCHDEIPKITIPARSREFDFRFNHAAHLAKQGVTCKTCHANLPEAKQAERSKLSMSACTSCHQHAKDFAEARCTPCHTDLKKYEKPVASFKHAGEWLKLHGAMARPTAESCAQCHEQTFCADCHTATTTPARQAIVFPEDVKRDFIHRGDFVSRHMIEAGASPASCRKCHGSQFCDACHSLQNVSPSALGGGPLKDPHPAGWVATGGGLHGAAARRNILACAACHDRGTDATQNTCLLCHRSGGANPHPTGFISKHKDDNKAAGVCRACHVAP